MTETSEVARSFSAGRASVGALLGLAGHVLAFAAGYVAARMSQPSVGGGFEDLVAAVGTLLAVEAVVGLACLIGAIVSVVRGRRDFGLGLIVGWVAGAVAGWLLITSQAG